MAHAEAYKDPGTPAEQTRRTFMVNTVIALGGVISLGLAVPLITSLVPAADATNDVWSPLAPDQWAALQKATDKPIKVSFNLHEVDGYLPPADEEQFVWAIKSTEADFQAKRPELFAGADKIPYAVGTLGFVIFSPICPHLGCRPVWNDSATRFQCPCHGSQFAFSGEHVAGPAPRGMDPLPLREQSGLAQIMWIRYESGVPNRVIISYQS